MGDKDSNKRVLIISSFIWTSGEFRGVRVPFELMLGFRRAGYEVHVITLDKSGLFDEYHGLHIHGVHLCGAGFPYGPLRSLHSFKLSRIRLFGYLKDKWFYFQFSRKAFVLGEKILGERPFDLVYGIGAYAAPVTARLGKRFGLPNVNHILGTFLFPYIEKVRANSSSRARLTLSARFTEVRNFILPASALIIDNDGTQGDLVADYLNVMCPIRFRVTGFSIQATDDEIAERIRGKLAPNGEKLVIWAGQLIEWKRLDRWLAVAAECLRQNPDLRFLVLGDGKLRKTLEEQAEALGISDAVKLLGAVDYADLWNYYKASDLFLCCHDLTNASNTLFEAMLCGLPVVTIANGSTNDFIAPAGGVAVPVGSEEEMVEGMARQVLAVLDDEERARTMRAMALRYASRNLRSWEDVAAEDIAFAEQFTRNHQSTGVCN